MTRKLPARSEIETGYKWNAESVFPTPADWDAEAAAVVTAIDGVRRFAGRLAEGPAIVADAMAEMQEVVRRIYVLYAYAGMAYAVDTTDAEATKRDARASSLEGMAGAAVSFIDPELLAIGEQTLRRWVNEEPKLAYLGHYVDKLSSYVDRREELAG